MYVIVEKVLNYMKKNGMTIEQFAQELDITVSEARSMLSGNRTRYSTASKFIEYFKADVAQHLIDWERLGIKNPLEK